MNFFTTFEATQSDFNHVFRSHKVVHVLRNEDVDADHYFRNLSINCGIPLIYEEDPITGIIDVNKWTEIKYEPTNTHNSYKSSNRFQPLHTDYGYFAFDIYASFFYCVAQADFGGATTFIDVETVVLLLKSVNPSLFNRIQQYKIHFGRKDNPLAHNDDLILKRDELGWKINWNYYRALGDIQNKTLVEDFKDFVDNYIEKSGELKELKLQPGEGVFFQDRRVLHGRNSFIGNRQLNKGGIADSIPQFVANLLNQ